MVENMNEIKLSLHGLIVEIHELDSKLRNLEEKYSLLSADFYQLYEAGQLRDEEIEEIDELGRWAAWYRMRARRMAQYEVMKDSYLAKNRHEDGIVLRPHQVMPEVA